MAIAHVLNGRTFKSRHLWKLRHRNAPSAPKSEKEICLYVYWNGDDFPTETQWKDPLLRSLWVLKTEWTYAVEIRVPGSSEFLPTTTQDERAALKLYRAEVKKFTRSKEVDYGRPIMDDGSPE
jgi:hypothetical protein